MVIQTSISAGFDTSPDRYPASGGGPVRYRTAAILSAVLVVVTVGMFGLSAAVWAVFLPSLDRGIPDPIPGYERILLEAAVLCSSFKWMLAILAPPIVVVLFVVAELTSQKRQSQMRSLTPAPTSQPPALWNPNAAASWSLLFSPAFGAYLHARNADAMGRADEAKANRVWFYVTISYFAFTLLPIPGIPEVLFRLTPIGLLLGWYFGTGKMQARYVKGTWRAGYERKSWKKPLIIALGCMIGACIVLTVAAKLIQALR
jgi:hypothetical protein